MLSAPELAASVFSASSGMSNALYGGFLQANYFYGNMRELQCSEARGEICCLCLMNSAAFECSERKNCVAEMLTVIWRRGLQ